MGVQAFKPQPKSNHNHNYLTSSFDINSFISFSDPPGSNLGITHPSLTNNVTFILIVYFRLWNSLPMTYQLLHQNKLKSFLETFY